MPLPIWNTNHPATIKPHLNPLTSETIVYTRTVKITHILPLYILQISDLPSVPEFHRFPCLFFHFLHSPITAFLSNSDSATTSISVACALFPPALSITFSVPHQLPTDVIKQSNTPCIPCCSV